MREFNTKLIPILLIIIGIILIVCILIITTQIEAEKKEAAEKGEDIYTIIDTPCLSPYIFLLCGSILIIVGLYLYIKEKERNLNVPKRP